MNAVEFALLKERLIALERDTSKGLGELIEEIKVLKVRIRALENTKEVSSSSLVGSTDERGANLMGNVLLFRGKGDTEEPKGESRFRIEMTHEQFMEKWTVQCQEWERIKDDWLVMHANYPNSWAAPTVENISYDQRARARKEGRELLDLARIWITDQPCMGWVIGRLPAE